MNPETTLEGRAMHDTDLFARRRVIQSIAGQPSINEMLHSFEQECEVTFKDEIFLVRDNGAIFRWARLQSRRRKQDEVWTFGTLDRHKGYLVIGSHVVHQIIASAFHGQRPSTDHVVDHIDTNRQNNRPDNLRWVTRLDNILLNPITRARIELAFGSLEAFFENPGASCVPNWSWMRTVTKEQAQESRKRLLEWAEKGKAGKGGTLGSWLYEPKPRPASISIKGSSAGGGISVIQAPLLNSPQGSITAVKAPLDRHGLDVPSLTESAFQRKWRTPTEFPECPESASGGALDRYLKLLKSGAIFARNQYGESTVVEAAIGPDNILSVVCNTQRGVKGWTHAKVYVTGDKFCHESGGTFFTQDGAMKAHCMTIGAPSQAFEGSIDDYC
jgi:hypothetical protein